LSDGLLDEFVVGLVDGFNVGIGVVVVVAKPNADDQKLKLFKTNQTLVKGRKEEEKVKVHTK